MTFSTIARRPDTGHLGVVVATYTPAAARAICVCSPGRGIAVVQALGSAALVERAGKLLEVDRRRRPPPACYATQAKRPTGRRWWRYMNEIGHGSRTDWLKKERA